MDERRNHLAATAEISRGGTVIIVQHATQALTAPDRSTIPSMGFVRDDQPVVETLVVSLAMIMHYEFVNSFALRSLTEQDDALQTGFLDAADESFGVAFRFGDRGGSFTDFTPRSASIRRNSTPWIRR